MELLFGILQLHGGVRENSSGYKAPLIIIDHSILYIFATLLCNKSFFLSLQHKNLERGKIWAHHILVQLDHV